MDDFLQDAEKLGSLIAIGVMAIIMAIDKIKQYKSKNAFGKYIKQKVKDSDSVVNDILQSLLELTLADRVHVWEFHNGGVSAGGRAFSHMTCTFEACREGVEPQARNLQTLPTSWYRWLVEKVVDNEVIEITDIETIKSLDMHTYSTLKMEGVKSFVLVPLKKGAYSIGFITVCYTRDDIKVEECIKMDVSKSAGMIERILAKEDK